MELREIKGFPNYMLNADTGEIISKLTRNTTLKLRLEHMKACEWGIIEIVRNKYIKT